MTKALPDVIVRTRQALRTLSGAQTRVAKAVLDDPATTVNETAATLAERSGASQASVVRFCRSLGYEGYADFRIALTQAITRRQADLERSGMTAGDVDLSGSAAELVSRLAYQEARAVEDTARTIPLEALSRAADAIGQADRVLLVGFGASGLTAQDLAQKLARIGLACESPVDVHQLLVSASLATPRTVVVAVSHHGSTVEVVDVVRVAQARGATIIAITNTPGSPLGTMSDIILTTAATESRHRLGAMTSRIAQLAAIDFLFVCVVRNRRDQAEAALAVTREAVASHRLPQR